MSIPTNLSSIIRLYAEKNNSPFIDFREFCIYIKKYAEHNVEEAGELVKYLGDASGIVSAELQGLSEKHLVALITQNNKKIIVSITYYSAKYANQYKEILNNDKTPYPLVSDLPKQFPLNSIEKKIAEDYIPSIINNQNTKSPNLYILEFSKEVPSMLLPACVSVKQLVESAQIKIRKVLKKEDYHDYILKKLRTTNSTKEISIQNFFQHFVDQPAVKFYEFEQGDDYYLWNQTLYYILQDLQKITDKTTEDVNIIQAARISEIYCVYLKSKFQEDQKRLDALHELESALGKAPYFFSMNQILKFQNQSGQLLYGNYGDEDLKNFFQVMTSEASSNDLPKLLVFKVDSGTKYYVYKNKVLNVVVRLCNEAHISVEKVIEEKWYSSLIDFEKLPEMNNELAFERLLKNIVEDESPILHALLNANFMTFMAMANDSDDSIQGLQIFENGKLLPYSKLLMLSYSKIYSDVKAKLPLIYTLPIISWIYALFGNKKNKKQKAKNKIQNEVIEEELNKTEKPEKAKNKGEMLANRAIQIAKEMIPEGSTLDRELDYLVKQWNTMISKDAYVNLTEDVNALIRDYTRRVVRTLTETSFTRERIENLATTLVRTPNMQKIKNNKALYEYVVLYMLRLVSNSKKNM
ncbi:MAG: hypothetical protein K5866_06870 [Treponema sp.]|nr:hypothetical protein [Treponema sp.]